MIIKFFVCILHVTCPVLFSTWMLINHTHFQSPAEQNLQRYFVTPHRISLLEGYELTGLSRGGQQVGKCQEVYAKAVKLLVELASLQVRYLSIISVCPFLECAIIFLWCASS